MEGVKRIQLWGTISIKTWNGNVRSTKRVC